MRLWASRLRLRNNRRNLGPCIIFTPVYISFSVEIMTQRSKKKYRVLLVDDSDADRFFLRKALSGNQKLAIVAEVEDGEEAIRYLGGAGGFSDRQKYPFPDLVLLDLKMPRTTGYEVLAWLRTQTFNGLKVVVLSGSVLPEDMAKTLDLGADAYHVKAVLKPEQEHMIREIESLLDGHWNLST
ncbi:MAG: response regulator receiver protein [Pedosphaera sp.]|nr:response regulator receiver protein [Pedosphaera sp.]